MRDEVVADAVQFLNHPDTAHASLGKRVEFLESKGLTPEEIEESLKRAQGVSSDNQATSTKQVTLPVQPAYMREPPPIPQRNWKDYFVMATVSVGVAYGLYEVAKRYVLPAIMPPTPPALEADKQALEAEFERTESLVEQLAKDMESVKEAESERSRQFEEIMAEAREVVGSIKPQVEDRRKEAKLASANIESMKDLLPKSLGAYSDSQSHAIRELQDELQSLKSLITNRLRTSGAPRPIPPASSVPSSLPAKDAVAANDTKEDSDSSHNNFIPNPGSSSSQTRKPSGIPAWQLAAKSNDDSKS